MDDVVNQMAAMRQAMEHTQNQLQATQTELQSTQSRLQARQTQMELERTNAMNAQLEQQRAVIDLHTKLRQKDKVKPLSEKVVISKADPLKADNWPEFKHGVDTYLAFLDKAYSAELKMAGETSEDLNLADMGDETETKVYSVVRNAGLVVFAKPRRESDGPQHKR